MSAILREAMTQMNTIIQLKHPEVPASYKYKQQQLYNLKFKFYIGDRTTVKNSATSCYLAMGIWPIWKLHFNYIAVIAHIYTLNTSDDLYPFSVHVATFNFITNLMDLFN